jgi:hypothetical protein
VWGEGGLVGWGKGVRGVRGVVKAVPGARLANGSIGLDHMSQPTLVRSSFPNIIAIR